MTRAWETLGKQTTEWGEVELRRRAEDDFLLTLGGRVVMTSAAHRSERALAELATEALKAVAAPRVLVAGLGMGFTLRSALDTLPPDAQVVVVELLPVVVAWCRGPLAALSEAALSDPRVRIVIGDVGTEIRAAASGGPRFDAIILDLFEGPAGDADPVLGLPALARIHEALSPLGVLTVWSERPERRFERALTRRGFRYECHRAGRGGLRHALYRARPWPADAGPSAKRIRGS